MRIKAGRNFTFKPNSLSFIHTSKQERSFLRQLLIYYIQGMEVWEIFETKIHVSLFRKGVYKLLPRDEINIVLDLPHHFLKTLCEVLSDDNLSNSRHWCLYLKYFTSGPGEALRKAIRNRFNGKKNSGCTPVLYQAWDKLVYSIYL